MENRRPNYFQQHITDVKNFLIQELEAEKQNKLEAANVTNQDSLGDTPTYNR